MLVPLCRRFLPRVFAALALVALMLCARLGRAEPTESDRATARSLAEEGYEALQRKDYATAVDRFRHADALVHAPTISVDLARSLIGLGRYVEAYERYQMVIREGAPKDAPSSWKQAIVDAEKEVTALEPRLGWIIIHVMGPLDPQVTIDGVDVPEASLGARRAADPGDRIVRANAPGFEPAMQTVTVKEGEEQTVTLVLDRSPAPREAAEPPPADRGRRPRHVSRMPAWIAFGAGGAGLVVGTVAGLVSLSARSSLVDSGCRGGYCTPADQKTMQQNQSDLNRYHTFGTISGIGFVAGLAGAATGAVLLITASASERSAQAARVWPLLGVREVGLAGRF